MTDPRLTLQPRRLAVIGVTILIAMYGAALFADFLAPYPADAEFREYFFHPPTSIHFRDSSGRFVWPYVRSTHLSDARHHIYEEGGPIRVARGLPDENKNPFLADIVEQDEPFAVIKNAQGRIVAAVATGRETAEDSGIFLGQTVVDPSKLGTGFTIEAGGTKLRFVLNGSEFSSLDKQADLFLTDAFGAAVTRYTSSTRQYPINFFTSGDSYRWMGMIHANVRLIGVEAPGHLFLLGTDQAGRDIFSRVLHGSRISLTIGLFGVCISTLLGLWIGAVSGYAGGKTDSLMMRTSDVIMSVPALYLILSVRNMFPENVASQATYALMILALGFTGWAAMARVIRGMVLTLREEEYVLAARALGASSFRILLRHILPNTFGIVLVRATLLIPAYILAEVTLSYLGIGIQEPVASWGNMLAAAQEIRVLEDFPWILAPGAFLFITVLGFNFAGDGLRRSN